MSLPPYDQSIRDFERQYQVVLPDPVGKPAVGFRDGSWFRLNSGAPHAIPIRSAIILCPHAAGSIVQIICWWMRENTRNARALDLATELALAVGEIARKAIEDDPLGMSVASLPDPPMAAQTPYGADPFATGLPTGFAGGPGPSAFPAGTPAPAGAGYGGDPYAGAATTLIPQIGAEPPGMLGLAGGRGAAAPMPSGRPAPAQGGGYGPARSGGYDRPTQMPGVQMPGPRPPAQPQPGYGGRPAPGRGGDPRGGGEWGGGRPAPAPSYDDADPRGDYYRGGGQPRRDREADYGGGRGGGGGGYQNGGSGEYPRQQAPRQRPDPGGSRAW